MDGAEVVWPWRSNNLAVRPLIQPLPAALLQDRLIALSQIARDQEHVRKILTQVLLFVYMLVFIVGFELYSQMSPSPCNLQTYKAVLHRVHL